MLMDFQEGPNPIMVRSNGQRLKVCAKEKAKIAHGDVLELIPGDYFVKYVDMGDEHKSGRVRKILQQSRGIDRLWKMRLWQEHYRLANVQFLFPIHSCTVCLTDNRPIHYIIDSYFGVFSYCY
jgi:hypothetical protein